MPRSRRTAPPIQVEVRRSYWQLACIVLLLLIAAAIAHPLSLLFFGIPLIAWYRSPTGILEWDGQHWHWNGALMPRLVLQLDWQRCMVVSGLWLDNPPIELRRAIVSSIKSAPQ